MAAKKKVAAPGLCVQGGPDIHPDVVEFVADPGNRAAVDQFIAREAALQASFEAIAAEIDTSMLVTAVAGGIERRDDLLGPGKRSYGVRASYALKDMTFDANLDYNKTKSFRGADDQSSTKFGLACSRPPWPITRTCWMQRKRSEATSDSPTIWRLCSSPLHSTSAVIVGLARRLDRGG
jgi:hypothetical protein